MACSSHLSLYADDAVIIVTDENKETIENKLKREIVEVSNWCFQSKLFLHLGKTEALLFGSAAKLKKCPNSEISRIRVGDEHFSFKQEVKFLGCILDNKMTGDSMAAAALSKINSRIKIFSSTGCLFRQTNNDKVSWCISATTFRLCSNFLA